jgi:hypothetical protein
MYTGNGCCMCVCTGTMLLPLFCVHALNKGGRLQRRSGLVRHHHRCCWISARPRRIGSKYVVSNAQHTHTHTPTRPRTRAAWLVSLTRGAGVLVNVRNTPTHVQDRGNRPDLSMLPGRRKEINETVANLQRHTAVVLAGKSTNDIPTHAPIAAASALGKAARSVCLLVYIYVCMHTCVYMRTLWSDQRVGRRGSVLAEAVRMEDLETSAAVAPDPLALIDPVRYLATAGGLVPSAAAAAATTAAAPPSAQKRALEAAAADALGHWQFAPVRGGRAHKTASA